MGRKSQDLLLRDLDDMGTEFDVLRAVGIWAVTFEGEIISLRERNQYSSSHTKYIRTSFPTRVAAENVAKKLNHRFKTMGFQALRLYVEELQ